MLKKLALLFIVLALFPVDNIWASTFYARLNGFIDYGHVPSVKSALKKAKEDDTVIITINSQGGMMEAGDEIRAAIKKSKGKVVAEIKGNAFSEAAFIAIACHDVKGKGTVMFHVGFMVDEYGDTGVPAGLTRKSLASVKPILTTNEYNRMAKGKDIFMSVDVLRERTCKAWKKGCVNAA